MDIVLEDQSGTLVLPWHEIISMEDFQRLEIVEKLRFIDLRMSAITDNCGFTAQYECARYDDNSLYLNSHDAYPVILRFRFRRTGNSDDWEWYMFHARGEGVLSFDKVTCFKVSQERQGYEAPCLWG